MNITCPQCGFSRDLPQNKIPAAAIIAKCPKCNCRFRFSSNEGVGAILPPKEWNKDNPPSEEDIRETARQAYENESRRFKEDKQTTTTANELTSFPIPWAVAPIPDGWFMAFYKTVLAIMLKPAYFFQCISNNLDWKRPAAFFLIVSLFQTISERLWSQIIYRQLSAQASDDPQLHKLLTMLVSESDFFISIILRMTSLIFQLFTFSLLLYLGYKLITKNKATYRIIFDIICYSTAPWLLCIIPGAGSIIGTFWSIACLAIGFKTALTLSWAETIAGFLPIFIIIVPVFSQILSLVSQ